MSLKYFTNPVYEFRLKSNGTERINDEGDEQIGLSNIGYI